MAPGFVLPEFGTPIGVVVICFSALSVLYIVHSSFFGVPRPKGVPLLRERPGKRTFSLKNRLSYFTDCESIYREAYHGVRVLKTQDMWQANMPYTVLQERKGSHHPGHRFA